MPAFSFVTSGIEWSAIKAMSGGDLKARGRGEALNGTTKSAPECNPSLWFTPSSLLLTSI